MERIETSLKRYKIVTKSLEYSLNSCSNRSDKIYSMLEEIQDISEELTFKQLIHHQIYIRL